MLSILQGIDRVRIHKILVASGSIGVFFGILFDALFGQHIDVFRYHIVAHISFDITNGVLSYGIAIATAALFPSLDLRALRQSPRYKSAIPFVIMDIIASLLIISVPNPTLSATFSAGVLVLASVEMLLAFCGWEGPFLSLVSGRFRPFCRFWLSAALIGFVYESANFYFPVWRWSLIDIMPQWKVEALVIVLGYVVLFHPLVVGWQLVRHKFRERSAKKFAQGE